MQAPMLPALPELPSPPTGALPKLPKELVLYKEAGPPAFTDEYKCLNCILFNNNKCNLVEGAVTPAAWCVIWIPRRPPFIYLIEKIEIPAIK